MSHIQVTTVNFFSRSFQWMSKSVQIIALLSFSRTFLARELKTSGNPVRKVWLQKTFNKFHGKSQIHVLGFRFLLVILLFFVILSLQHRFPWNVLRFNTMCNSWTWKDVGVGTVLRSFNMCCFRRHSTKVSWDEILIKKIFCFWSKTFLIFFKDCSSSSRTADHFHLPMTNVNWTLKLPTRQLLSHIAVRPSSARLELS